jgi:hypothetical protein
MDRRRCRALRGLDGDERLRGTTSYADKWRASVNREVAKNLAE